MAFRRRFRRFGMRRRASVAWIPGVTGLNPSAPSQAKTLALSALSTSPNTYAAAIILVNDDDLKLHGGEDAVFMRARGTLWLYGAVATEVVDGWWARVVIALSEVDAGGNVFPAVYTDGAGLGRDEIMWEQDCFISTATSPQGGITAGNVLTTLPLTARIDIDVKAKRRMDSGKVPVLWIQTVKSGSAEPQQITYAGGLRMLVRRPR